VRASIAYAESAERAVSILDYRPDLGADYLALADEILERLKLSDARSRLRDAGRGRRGLALDDLAQLPGLDLVDEAADRVLVRDERARLDAGERLADVRVRRRRTTRRPIPA